MDDIWWMMEDGRRMTGESPFAQLGFLRDSLVAFIQGSRTPGHNYVRRMRDDNYGG